MSKLKYTTIYEDENLIDGSFWDTEEEAIAEWEDNTGEKWSDGHASERVQGFTQEEIDNLGED